MINLVASLQGPFNRDGIGKIASCDFHSELFQSRGVFRWTNKSTDGMAIPQQALCEMTPDKTRRPGDQYFH
jgi:hypothetical protein